MGLATGSNRGGGEDGAYRPKFWGALTAGLRACRTGLQRLPGQGRELEIGRGSLVLGEPEHRCQFWVGGIKLEPLSWPMIGSGFPTSLDWTEPTLRQLPACQLQFGRRRQGRRPSFQNSDTYPRE